MQPRACQKSLLSSTPVCTPPCACFQNAPDGSPTLVICMQLLLRMRPVLQPFPATPCNGVHCPKSLPVNTKSAPDQAASLPSAVVMHVQYPCWGGLTLCITVPAAEHLGKLCRWQFLLVPQSLEETYRNQKGNDASFQGIHGDPVHTGQFCRLYHPARNLLLGAGWRSVATLVSPAFIQGTVHLLSCQLCV